MFSFFVFYLSVDGHVFERNMLQVAIYIINNFNVHFVGTTTTTTATPNAYCTAFDSGHPDVLIIIIIM